MRPAGRVCARSPGDRLQRLIALRSRRWVALPRHFVYPTLHRVPNLADSKSHPRKVRGAVDGLEPFEVSVKEDVRDVEEFPGDLKDRIAQFVRVIGCFIPHEGASKGERKPFRTGRKLLECAPPHELSDLETGFVTDSTQRRGFLGQAIEDGLDPDPSEGVTRGRVPVQLVPVRLVHRCERASAQTSHDFGHDPRRINDMNEHTCYLRSMRRPG